MDEVIHLTVKGHSLYRRKLFEILLGHNGKIDAVDCLKSTDFASYM